MPNNATMLEDHLLQACRRRVDQWQKITRMRQAMEAPPVKKQLKSTSVGTFVNATMRSIRSSAALLALILITSSAAAFSPIALQRSANNAAKCTPNKHSQVDKVKVASSSSVSAALASSNAKVKASSFTALSASSNSDDDKFSFAQRIESLKCAVVGAVSGALCLAPFAAYHAITICCTAMLCR